MLPRLSRECIEGRTKKGSEINFAVCGLCPRPTVTAL